MIAYSKPTLDSQESEAVARVLASGWLAAGAETEAFEREFAEFVGVKYAVFTNSCTSALKIAYKWAKEKGYGYLTYNPNTFCATYSAAAEMGMNIPKEGTPIASLYKWCHTSMHYGGLKDETPCLIEDSAHRIEPNDPLVGKMRCYSFYVTKNMTTGSGGMFVTNDEEIYNFARLCWRDGLTTSTADRMNGFNGYEVKLMAGGYDGNDIAAAIGRVQLKKLPGFIERRNQIRDTYNKAFNQDWQGNHLYPFFVKDEAAVYKAIPKLREFGVSCSHNYPGTGWNGISLPIYPTLTDSEVQTIIDAVCAVSPTLT